MVSYKLVCGPYIGTYLILYVPIVPKTWHETDFYIFFTKKWPKMTEVVYL